MKKERFLKVENFDRVQSTVVFEEFFEENEKGGYKYDSILIIDGYSVKFNNQIVWVHPIISTKNIETVTYEQGITATEFKKHIFAYQFNNSVDKFNIIAETFNAMNKNSKYLKTKQFCEHIEFDNPILFRAQSKWLRENYRVGETFDFYIIGAKFTSEALGQIVRSRYASSYN